MVMIVAKDGSSNYTTIGAALKAVPEKSNQRIIIHVKKGIYTEKVIVDQSKRNVMMVGDGMNDTIMSGSLNVVDGTPTFSSATFAIPSPSLTADFLPQQLQRPMPGTKVKLLDYKSSVELVLQGTNLVAGEDHPMHLHGHSFYVVGWGFGNFNKKKDPLRFNLIDPPHQNTALVPKNGWIAISFNYRNVNNLN
ncbi:hypothetical protein NE237_027582 [Protea cynaroides]|uniref:Pectinesterase n=1 Tax=Protea cynaroides TaxID=273540 RepID=A0A9Q0JUD1_9MAGN|nr:hypothetical protein NE237_027582 [Protea cynaroides]